MNLKDEKKLDNPVWHSLNEIHEKFSLNYGSLKCYHPDFCPFGGYENSVAISGQIDEYAELIHDFFIERYDYIKN